MFNPVSNNEKNFLLANLQKNGFREDRRGIEDFREIILNKLDENGQVEVKLGQTLIISQIFAKLIYPSNDRASEGVIIFNVSNKKYNKLDRHK